MFAIILLFACAVGGFFGYVLTLMSAAALSGIVAIAVMIYEYRLYYSLYCNVAFRDGREAYRRQFAVVVIAAVAMIASMWLVFLLVRYDLIHGVILRT